jgi:hypothetical protein
MYLFKIIIYGTNQLHVSESWSFNVQVKYISEQVDHLKYISSTFQWELIIYGTNQVHLNESSSFKIQDR